MFQLGYTSGMLRACRVIITSLIFAPAISLQPYLVIFQEIIVNAKALSFNQEQVISMETQVKTLHEGVTKGNKNLKALGYVLHVLNELDKEKEENTLSMELLWNRIGNLEKMHSEEYVSFNLANVTLTYLIPLMKSHLIKYWRPLDSKSTDEETRISFQQWRSILEFHQSTAISKYTINCFQPNLNSAEQLILTRFP